MRSPTGCDLSSRLELGADAPKIRHADADVSHAYHPSPARAAADHPLAECDPGSDTALLVAAAGR